MAQTNENTNIVDYFLSQISKKKKQSNANRWLNRLKVECDKPLLEITFEDLLQFYSTQLKSNRYSKHTHLLYHRIFTSFFSFLNDLKHIQEVELSSWENPFQKDTLLEIINECFETSKLSQEGEILQWFDHSYPEPLAKILIQYEKQWSNRKSLMDTVKWLKNLLNHAGESNFLKLTTENIEQYEEYYLSTALNRFGKPFSKNSVEKGIEAIKGFYNYIDLYLKTNNLRYESSFKDYDNPFRKENPAKHLLDDQSYRIFQEYLFYLSRSTYKNMVSRRPICIHLFKFTGKKSFFRYNSSDINKFLIWIDKKPIILISKQTYYDILFGLFDFIEDQFTAMEIEYYNPVQSFKFTPDPHKTIKEKQEGVIDEFFTQEELKIIIEKGRFFPYEVFIQFTLLIFCGMRISEVLSLRKDDFLLEERYCEIHGKTGEGAFCFPEDLVGLLTEYLTYHEQKFGVNEAYMFPNEQGTYTALNSHNGYTRIYKYLRKISPKFGKTHNFRRTLTKAFGEAGVPLPDIEYLTNHKIKDSEEYVEIADSIEYMGKMKSIEDSYYAKMPISYRREKYDKYLPKMYKTLAMTINEG